MRVIITGGTGFIGRTLSGHLVEAGYEVIALSRKAKTSSKILGEKITLAEWEGKTSKGWVNYADGAFAIVNLAGENIAGGRWTEAKKQAIMESRLNAGNAVVQAVKETKEKPKVIIQSSGIGYYGVHSEEIVDETVPLGSGFLPEVAERWENSTREVESFGVRHIIIRTGVVLGKDEGALPRLIMPFRFFFGGHPGNGEQYFSWIHLQDEIRAIRFLMEREDLNGIFNLTAPGSLKMKDFSSILGKVMRRPSWFPLPGFLLRMIFGQMAEETILTGQRVLPKRLQEYGFKFLYPEAEPALQEILNK
ncbi:MAG: TIGR01777 family oxidoreductase [candidate division Zixibacteria bacterium]|nr:TIGR01777 family oxidoreductase [candidate division Zixibacteria bacterium]